MNFFHYFAIYLLRPIRMIVLTALIIVGLVIVALAFPSLAQTQRSWIVRHWTRAMLSILGIRLSIIGVPPVGMALIVANHVSWIDPFLLLACFPVHFVAKAEIQHWPLLGWLVAKAGTVFIQRHRQRDLSRVAQIFVTHLHQGTAVGLFPESTTSDGTQLLPFKSALFEVAISTAADCYPVALRYDNVAAIWIEDMGLLASIWRVMAQPHIAAKLILCPVIRFQGQRRRELASASKAAIANALYPPVPHIQPEKPDDLPAAVR